MSRCISTCAFFLGMSFPAISPHTTAVSMLTPEFFQKREKRAWLSDRNVVIYSSSPQAQLQTSGVGWTALTEYARVAELADAHVWGACGLSLGVRVPSLAPEGKSVFDLPFFYKQKWWNGRHAGFRHQFLVSEGSSPFFCITWKSAWILENSVFVRIFCICGLSNTIEY